MASRRTHTPPAPEQQGDNLTRISGVGPVVAGRLAEAGIRTYRSVAEAKPEELAAALVGVPGCSADRIRSADWIGQAQRLGTARASARTAEAAEPRPARTDADGPPADDTPFLRVVRLGRARIRPVHDPSRSDQPTTVGLELRRGAAAPPAPALDYTAAIAARRLDAAGEIPIVQVGGVVRVDRGISHSAAGPPLEAGLYRLVASIELHPPGHDPGEPPVWRQAASGDLIQVVTPAGAARHGNGHAAKPHPVGKRLLDEGVISEAEYADLQVPGGSS
jgi:hypothetical protein